MSILAIDHSIVLISLLKVYSLLLHDVAGYVFTYVLDHVSMCLLQLQ